MPSLKEFKIMGEDATHLTVKHPNGKQLRVDKSTLSPAAKKHLMHFDDGGAVDVYGYPVKPGSNSAPPPQPDPDKAKGFVKGVLGYAHGIVDVPAPPDSIAAVPAAPAIDAGTPDLTTVPADANAQGVPATLQPNAPEATAPQPDQAPDASEPVNPVQAAAVGKNAALGLQEAGIQGEANAISSMGADQSKAIQDTTSAISNMKTADQIVADNKNKDEALMQAYNSKQIDPDRYWANKSTGSKVLAGISMALGGFGAGASGQQNLAAKYVEDSINKDIDAQKNAKEGALNLWKMNREALGTDLAANLQTKNQMYTGLQYKLQQAAANASGPMAQAKALQAISLVEQEKAANNQKLAIMGASDMDPAKKVQFLVPPEHQKAVFDEIKDAQNNTAITPKILQAFDNAAQNKYTVDFIPGMKNADQKQFSALINTTVKEQEGTARQAAFDSIEKNMMPQAGDSKETLQKKRQAVQEYMSSKSSAPTASGYGIDLKKSKSTAGGQTYQPGQVVEHNGAKYVVGTNGKATRIK